MRLTRAALTAKWRGTALIASLCLLLGACSLAPKYERPEMDMPAQWRKVDLGTVPLHTDWWKRFNDPVLTALIEQALEKNQDLAKSLADIDSAAAQMGVATANLAPMISGGGAAGAEGASEATANTGSFAAKGMSRSYLNYQLQASASWELDLWGKLRWGREEAAAEYLASVEARRAVQMTLTVGVTQIVELTQLLHVFLQTADGGRRAGADNIYAAFLLKLFQLIAFPIISGVTAGNSLGQGR